MEWHAASYWSEKYEPNTDDSDEEHFGILVPSKLYGVPRVPLSPKEVSVRDVDSMLAYMARIGPGIDVAELCGGVGRTVQAAVRRRLRSGQNFDLVTGFDLGHPGDQRKVFVYVNENEVLVVVVAPSCRALGPPSNLDYNINHAPWRAAFDQDRPHLECCGKLPSCRSRMAASSLLNNHGPLGSHMLSHGPRS